MLTMERKYRYLFTLCLIIGFQIHVPVTMLPAIAEPKDRVGSGWMDSYLDTGASEGSLRAGLRSQTVITTDNQGKGQDESIAAHVTEYNMPAKNQREQVDYNSVIGSHTVGHYQLNTNVNPARPVDHQGIDVEERLPGSQGSSDLKQHKADKSEFNRLKSDLVSVKLKQIEARLNNLSRDLSTRKNLLSREKDKENIQNLEHKNNLQTQTHIKIDQRFYISKEKNNITRHHKQSNFINGLFWSEYLDHSCVKGFTEKEYRNWNNKVDNYDVISMEQGCGSMQNRLVTFNDSTKACVRYRMNAELMQGDIYSFYLSKLLNMGYIPPTTMTLPINSHQWRRVKEEAERNGWSEHKPAIVSQWISELQHVYMPPDLRDEKVKLRPQNNWFENRPKDELCEIVQWTDLIVFDYISGHLDRVVNNLVNLKWNSKMLEKPIHNLMKARSTGLFLFLDNESGLFHGYRLLDSYADYHDKLLESVCIFRKSTVDAIKRLFKGGNTGEMLQNLYQTNEQFHGYLPRMSKTTMNIIQERITDVYKHIKLCENNFSSEFSNR